MQIYCLLTWLLVISIHHYVFCSQWCTIWCHWQQTSICC